MIISKLVSGLGNQFFQYAMGRQLALTKGVDLKLDLGFFAGQSLRSYKLKHYPIQATVADKDEINKVLHPLGSKGLSAKLYSKLQRRLPKTKRRHFQQTDWWVYEPEIYQLPSNTYLEGYWQHHRYWQELPGEVLDELRLSTDQLEPHAGIVRHIEDSPDAVAVHIRRGDYVTDKNANNFLGVLPIEYYNQAFVYFKAVLKTPHFYLFSDDLGWVRDNITIDSPCYYVEEGEDYIQLELMSRCQHNIIANSSYSWWGAFLNQNTSKKVVAPRQWVVPPQLNSQVQIQMPTWVLL